MIPVRVAMAALLLLLPMAGGLGAWADAHRGYPDAVYYQENILSGTAPYLPSPVMRFDTWTDPVAGRQLAVVQAGDRRSTRLIVRDCLYGQVDTRLLWSAVCSPTVPLLSQQSATSGFGAFVQQLLAQRNGPIVRVQLDGQPALRFGFKDTLGGATAWLDPDSHALLQWGHGDRWGGISDVNRVIRQSRLAPNTLPADFFDPPTNHLSLWDRARGWVEDRLAGR